MHNTRHRAYNHFNTPLFNHKKKVICNNKFSHGLAYQVRLNLTSQSKQFFNYQSQQFQINYI